jgi:hypothetical protein
VLVDPVLHLRLKFQSNIKQTYDCPGFPLLSKWTKYREPKSINWKHNFKILMDSVEDYARQWAKREKDFDTLSKWMKSVREIMEHAFVINSFWFYWYDISIWNYRHGLILKIWWNLWNSSMATKTWINYGCQYNFEVLEQTMKFRAKSFFVFILNPIKSSRATAYLNDNMPFRYLPKMEF